MVVTGFCLFLCFTKMYVLKNVYALHKNIIVNGNLIGNAPTKDWLYPLIEPKGVCAVLKLKKTLNFEAALKLQLNPSSG